MTADNPAATATADPNAAAAQTTADATATNTTNAEGSKVTPPDGATTNEPQNPDGNTPPENAAPESYADFTVPEGIEIDRAAIEKYAPIFKELGLTQEQAQRLVDLRAQEVKELNDGAGASLDRLYQERRAQEIKDQTTEWGDQTNAAKDIGPEVKARVMAAVGELATPEFSQAMDEHGWGNHPELIRLVNRLIDYVPSEKGERAASGGGVQDNSWRARAERMYST